MTPTELMQEQTNKSTQAYAVLERAVCVTLSFSYLGNNRKVDLDELGTSAGGGTDKSDATATGDESVFHATKRLLDPKVLRPCGRVIGKAKAFMVSASLPMSSVFGDRTYLIPIALVEDVDAQMEKFREELAEECVKLSESYDAAKEEQREKLGPHFKDSDYMTLAEVRKSFSMDWSYVTFASPDRLQTVSMALAQRSRAKYESQLEQAYEQTVLTLRQRARDVMAQLAHKLKPGPDGKPRTLRGTALDDLREFCDRLPAMNSIAGDDDLVEAVSAVEAATTGMDVKDLRDNEALRAQLATLAADVSEQLDALVVARSRAISFGTLEE